MKYVDLLFVQLLVIDRMNHALRSRSNVDIAVVVVDDDNDDTAVVLGSPSSNKRQHAAYTMNNYVTCP